MDEGWSPHLGSEGGSEHRYAGVFTRLRWPGYVNFLSETLIVHFTCDIIFIFCVPRYIKHRTLRGGNISSLPYFYELSLT